MLVFHSFCLVDGFRVLVVQPPDLADARQLFGERGAILDGLVVLRGIFELVLQVRFPRNVCLVKCQLGAGVQLEFVIGVIQSDGGTTDGKSASISSLSSSVACTAPVQRVSSRSSAAEASGG